MKNRVFMIFTAIVLLASCVSVSNEITESYPREETAVIKSNYWDWGNLSVVVVVQVIDGKDVGLSPGDIRILPGEHTVRIRVTHYYSWLNYDMGYCTLKLFAESGHTYKVHGAMKKRIASAWIVDTNTGQIVAGNKPD